MAELKITAANFENEVLRSDKPILLDFYGLVRTVQNALSHTA